MITGRVKEQYKLENGKSVMPTPIEEQLALSPGVSQVMLYGADHPSNVALVAIDAAQVRTWAHEQGVPVSGDLAAVPAVHDLIATELGRLAAGFRGYEPPRAFVLTCDPFSSDNGMLTPTLKLRRRDVVARYGRVLDAHDDGGPVPPSPTARRAPARPVRHAT